MLKQNNACLFNSNMLEISIIAYLFSFIDLFLFQKQDRISERSSVIDSEKRVLTINKCHYKLNVNIFCIINVVCVTRAYV